jgi:putative oxidoreductase
MHALLGRFEPQFYAILRIVAGLLFACHGAQKLFGAFGGQATTDPVMMFGGVIELVGGLLIAIGLLTSWAAFLASGMMAVAFFKVHFKADAPLPINNGGELAVVYCFLFLYMAARGAGIWSVAAALKKPKLS